MKFVYGKQDWKTLERGEENCYLMTNGLGGFSSQTMIGSCGRNDHALFMACVHSPNHRYNMIHRLEEVLWIGGKKVHISSQDFAGEKEREEGFVYQNGFSFEDYPEWTYLVEGAEIKKRVVLGQGVNTVGISYDIQNRSGRDVVLEVIPHLQFVPKGELLSREQSFDVEIAGGGKAGENGSGEKAGCSGRISSNGQILHFRTNGEAEAVPLWFHDQLYSASDVMDGKRERGCVAANHRISFRVPAGETGELRMVYGMGKELPTVADLCDGVKKYREGLRTKAGFNGNVPGALSAAAGQFVSYRESTGKQTILAGFPFFEDWGRDTMIALTGCCLVTGQFETARSILETFMTYCRKGLMPNLFPEGKNAPGYNTVDASLLFILAVYEYYRRTKDADFVGSAYKTMEEIVGWYHKGTDFGIRMDEDGLIMAGRDFDQVTWMDVRIGEILPTPRHGKPVEINAYWYNALRIMEEFRGLLSEGGNTGINHDLMSDLDYGQLAGNVKKSFSEKFWNEEAGCLKDVLSGTAADGQIRCNQIWAVSLPFSVLSPEREKQVVEVVFRRLYTPYGLRTLSPEDKEFHPFYGGKQFDRDMAYHQGTVWVFPLGAYYLAYLKVNGYSADAKAYVSGQLETMEAALREGCIGQLPEIYDGGNPVSSKGCFAQAWSVGEILRVYDALRGNEL